jgi:predicted transcriptional regulator
MIIDYKFSSDIEPTDEQLHLLMQDVAAEVKEKARKSDKQFFEQLQQLLHRAKKQQLINNPEAK